MTGTFHSRDQHLADPENYFDIRLVTVPIWTERADGPWLYVEQAAAEALDRPYRQRVYHLVAQPDGSVRSDIYALSEPLAFAGCWRTATPLADVAPKSLQLRDGCSVLLQRRADTSWTGSTIGTGCPSERGGAAYATSEVELTPTGMTALDRGFDTSGKQVWGATKGPYRFQKLANTPPR
jgi:hypothetical protein